MPAAIPISYAVLLTVLFAVVAFRMRVTFWRFLILPAWATGMRWWTPFLWLLIFYHVYALMLPIFGLLFSAVPESPFARGPDAETLRMIWLSGVVGMAVAATILHWCDRRWWRRTRWLRTGSGQEVSTGKI